MHFNSSGRMKLSFTSSSLFFAACLKKKKNQATYIYTHKSSYFCCPYGKLHLHAFVGLHCGEWVAYEYVFCAPV